MPENVKIYDGDSGKWVSPKAGDKDAVAQHEAIVAGKPLPSDRTAEELARLEPGFAGPVATAGPVASTATVAPAANTGATRTP